MIKKIGVGKKYTYTYRKARDEKEESGGVNLSRNS